MQISAFDFKNIETLAVSKFKSLKKAIFFRFYILIVSYQDLDLNGIFIIL